MPITLDELKDSLFVLNVSGGKDSVAASVYFYMKYRPRNAVMVYAHTPLALEENLRYVEKLANWLGVELLVVRPSEKDGLRLLVRSGWPSPFTRFCMDYWKRRPLFKALEKQKTKPHTHVLGVRLLESRRRYVVFHAKGEGPHCNKKFGVFYYFPIIRWTESDVWDFLYKNDVPRNPLWKPHGHSSHDCVVCIVYATADEYRWLKHNYPQLWRRLLEVYRELNNNRRKKSKILAWGYADLDEIDRQTNLIQFIEPHRKRCEQCMVD